MRSLFAKRTTGENESITLNHVLVFDEREIVSIAAIALNAAVTLIVFRKSLMTFSYGNCLYLKHLESLSWVYVCER